jgi:hypothetical protein
MSVVRLAILGLAALASVATSAPMRPRAFPLWRVTGAQLLQAGCARLTPWVSKSGKTGLGVSWQLDWQPGAACKVGVAGATLTIAGQQVQVPGVAELSAGATTTIGEPPDVVTVPARLYLPVPFDGEASWNAGVREATLDVVMTVDGAPTAPTRLVLRHEWPDPHEYRNRDERRHPAPVSQVKP